ncbi:hypothetical protein ASPVEDRAFT_44247 [Aspergillus versicolor CBS 583.65]|uniref:DUF1640 domain-containing protein n=1 Tax=Aspergillus versicolor CBS 583.65 TaxID=1036611 RepID=A0A1L9PT61_ASPVE|nr:uncharacterized protein ASPVEDRAFT_44247 [Aspergillus versicolor CBS 583.65]OJJ04714.1 hypothetical protein ASPVEDRAFT_44247 [Aspergillus versicolor CBS 583.65]
MASPRLPFLYPNLMRAVKSCEPSTYRSLRVPSNARPPRPSRAAFHTTRRSAQGSIQRRYGPAVEPNIPPPSRPTDESTVNQDPESPPPEKKSDANSPSEQSQSQSQSRDTAENAPAESSQVDSEKAAQSAESKEADEQQVEPEEEEEDRAEPEVLEAKQPIPSDSKEPQSEERRNAPIFDGNPLDGVLHMPSPSAYLTPTASPPQQAPHMAPPPYVHHFDTYSLVQDLATGGFSDKQSVTIMKAVRTILQNNLDFAKQNLTSKSDVENETYLFKAACSELQSSLQTARNSEVQRQRASRTSLQHESDILSQRTNQELAGLKDDIKGMFNDHKMTVRELQRSIDTSVQELNYKITVSLNSDSKSEIEGLRWILTRRAALAIAISAFMILLFLRYSSTHRAQNTPEKKETPPKETKEAQKSSEASHRPQDAVPVTHLSESLG